ncbi:hypoxanthine phosphoribosyltransferase [Desulfobacterota bacterium AH_259_B03_O07]|nr:hypoxanthine phosphoribosyltransferase [Desulfobacterota bacterium AH_259_B03_O07]
MNEDIERILITEKEISERVKELGKAISRDYSGKDPVLVAVLRGAIVFLCDLLKEISIPMSLDFLSISSYSGQVQTGVVRILKDLDQNIEDKYVILIEDIIDTGLTLNYILRTLKARKPAGVRVCALLDKKVRRIVDIPIDYRGFEIPDEFVVGYGMDYEQGYRNLPFIAVLKEEILGK